MAQAYELALMQRANLQERWEKLLIELASEGSRHTALSFNHLLATRGMAALNMKTVELARFLAEGQWLNVREVLHREGLRGKAFERELGKRLGQFYASRKKLESILEFGLEVHYLSLNLGGVGLEEPHGPWCVIFDYRSWLDHCTCFAGDPLRVCFSGDG